MLDKGLRHYDGYRFMVPVCGEVQYPERDLPIDPYVFGAWLGDGGVQKTTSGIQSPAFTCHEDDALVELLSYLDDDYDGTGWTEEDVSALITPGGPFDGEPGGVDRGLACGADRVDRVLGSPGGGQLGDLIGVVPVADRPGGLDGLEADDVGPGDCGEVAVVCGDGHAGGEGFGCGLRAGHRGLRGAGVVCGAHE
jgi:hypothetical protein